MKSLSVTVKMKATEQYFPLVLFIVLSKLVQTFGSVEIITLQHEHLNKAEQYFVINEVVHYAQLMLKTEFFRSLT